MALGRLLVETQKVASKFLHTRFTHKEKILTRIFIGITSYSRTPITIAAFPLPRFFCRTIEGNTVTMHSSGENSRKRKDNSDKRGEYRKFDEFSSQIRDLLIKSYARKVIAHVAVNDGSCKQGFIKILVDMAAEVVPALEITHNNINNKVRHI
jgi:hypothetical protein